MALTVVLRTSPEGEECPALTFDGARVVIGRGPSCDVRLPDPSVSNRHATIRAKDGEYALVDEKSRNGTFVGNAKLSPDTPRPIKNGDQFRVGRVWLEVRIDQTPATRDLAAATRDLALALVSQAMRAMGEEPGARVRVVEGPDAGAVLVLADEGRAYTIGRDATCDLALADVDVSREHVQLVRRGGAALVRDLGSKNGVVIGDARVPDGRDVAWKGGVMRLGATALDLEEPAALALAELEAAEDEPMKPEDAPPAPPPLGATRTGTDAPIVDTTAAAPVVAPRPAPPKPRLHPMDMAVMLVALGILALSLAGLFWLLHG